MTRRAPQVMLGSHRVCHFANTGAGKPGGAENPHKLIQKNIHGDMRREIQGHSLTDAKRLIYRGRQRYLNTEERTYKHTHTHALNQAARRTQRRRGSEKPNTTAKEDAAKRVHPPNVFSEIKAALGY